MKVYEALAQAVEALNRNPSNKETEEVMVDKIKTIMESAPCGSGFDSGTKFLEEKSNCKRLVFRTAFHHMNYAGYYDGWTNHLVTVEADLILGTSIRVSGKDRNDIKDYIGDAFGCWIGREVNWLTGEVKC